MGSLTGAGGQLVGWMRSVGEWLLGWPPPSPSTADPRIFLPSGATYALHPKLWGQTRVSQPPGWLGQVGVARHEREACSSDGMLSEDDEPMVSWEAIDLL